MSAQHGRQLTHHILAWLFVLILSFLGCFYLIGSSVYMSSLQSQASSIADMVTHVGHWAGQFKGGIWVKSGIREQFKPQDFLDKKSYEVSYMKGEKKRTKTDHYHLKNPSLIQRELSDITFQSNADVKFRITSDNFLNPNNAPNEFEKNAIELIKGEFHTNEYFTTKNNLFLYAREITAERSCLSCHGKPEHAPKKLQTLYPGKSGYNYEQGRLAGIVSVTLPYSNSPITLIENTNLYVLIVLGLFLVLLACFAFYIFSVINSTNKTTNQ